MEIVVGDCVGVMQFQPANHFDACVTDPPYGLEFLNKEWDKDKDNAFHEAWASEVYRVIRPGGYLLSFAGSRTSHVIAHGIERAGFKIRDTIIWTYKTGFPKSVNLSKSEAWKDNDTMRSRYAGWGTALKPAHEPIIMAQKPFTGTYCANIEKWGTGGINIEACRQEGMFPSNVVYFKKASIKEKNKGLEGLPLRNNMRVNAPRKSEAAKFATLHRNNHPTVKPLALMEYLLRLVVPRHGYVLDPFLGSGTTLVAAQNLGLEGLGIEYIEEYAEIARHRLGLNQETLLT